MANGFELIDVGGSFKRFLQNAPKEVRAEMTGSAKRTATELAERIRKAAPVGPDAPHIRDAITVQGQGLAYRVGIFDPEQAFIALLNEYTPNQQPFMRPSGEAEGDDFVRRSTEALRQVERALSIGL